MRAPWTGLAASDFFFNDVLFGAAHDQKRRVLRQAWPLPIGETVYRDRRAVPDFVGRQLARHLNTPVQSRPVTACRHEECRSNRNAGLNLIGAKHREFGVTQRAKVFRVAADTLDDFARGG